MTDVNEDVYFAGMERPNKLSDVVLRKPEPKTAIDYHTGPLRGAYDISIEEAVASFAKYEKINSEKKWE